MIDDVFTTGAVAGLIANVPANIFGLIMYRLGISKIFIWQISATVFVENKDMNTPPGIFMGAINDYIMAGLKGVLTAYLLYFTGTEFYLFKGIAVSLFFWIVIFGMILRTNIAGYDPVDPLSNITYLIWHVLLGILTPLLIIYM